MKAYLPKSFIREAKSDGVSDDDCIKAIRKAEKGLIDAVLAAGLIKQRIPRANQGAARGSRAVIFYKRGEVAVFLHIFPKSGKANLTKGELAEYIELAHGLAKLTDEQLLALSSKREWRELEI
jgi:hypothetical protein